MAVEDMPKAEVEIDEPLVRRLLEAQHHDLAGLALTLVDYGWDNVVFRLGDELAVRLPRREAAAGLVEREQRWLPVLGPALPLPVPVPVRTGRPAPGYPWSWSVVPWFTGSSGATTPLRDPRREASVLGRFLAALHVPASAGAPVNPYRGIALAHRAERVHEDADRVAEVIDAPRVLGLWAELSAGPPWTGPPLWLHGDLHPANLVVARGSLAAVLDWGDLTAGDPATDLAIAWMLFAPAERGVFRAAVGAVDDGTWARAAAWAVALGLAYLASSGDNAVMAAVGRRTLEAVLRGPR